MLKQPISVLLALCSLLGGQTVVRSDPAPQAVYAEAGQSASSSSDLRIEISGPCVTVQAGEDIYLLDVLLSGTGAEAIAGGGAVPYALLISFGTQGEIRGMDWLEGHAEPGAVVYQGTLPDGPCVLFMLNRLFHPFAECVLFV